jgi:hypothetical protein
MTRGMLRNFRKRRHYAGVCSATVLVLALGAAGCSSGGVSGPAPAAASAPPPATSAAPPSTATTSAAPPPPPAPSFKDRVASFFSTATQKEPQPVTNAKRDVECPLIDIREGASTLTIPPPPPDGETNAMALKYQGTFVRAARECSVISGQMVMKIGVQGRIIVGPAGGPGQLEVPLRIAIVNEPLVGSKLVATKLIRIPVTVPPNAGGADFTHIEEAMSFPMPTDGSLDSYLVYIGFDPVGAAAQDKPQPKPTAAKPKAKKPNPNAPTG